MFAVPLLTPLRTTADSWTVVRKEEVNCNNLPNNACAYAVLKSDVRKQLVVLFRGTVGNEQLLTELFSLYPQEFGGLGFVHAYFKTAFETVWFVCLLGIHVTVFLSTFGEPRVGDSRLAASVDNRLQFAFRVVNKADLIPHVPFCASWGSSLLQAPVHRLPPAARNLVPERIRQSPEDTRGSNSLVNGYTAADHLSYFNLDLAYFALQNCVA
ncbi:Lipase-3 domain-containing protein [Aphelenchoides fujianensis]|nr:Lipase-3 domain-containing protein [Aphelenchoides fujianensis]